MKDRGERGEGGGSLKYSIPEGKRGWGQHVLIFTPGNLSRGKQTRSRLLLIFLSVVYHNLMGNKLKNGYAKRFFWWVSLIWKEAPPPPSPLDFMPAAKYMQKK